jgi:hypothetical protein
MSVGLSVAAIILFSGIYGSFLPLLFDRLMMLSEVGKVLISIVLIGPLAFFMGMPFPLGLARVGAAMESLIPWSWGINGCASVMGSILATLLAIHLGFKLVIGLALTLYAFAALAFWRPLD